MFIQTFNYKSLGGHQDQKEKLKTHTHTHTHTKFILMGMWSKLFMKDKIKFKKIYM